jgi:tripartite-type tricarboxylate transporter receptor subunit TctC
MSSTFKRKLLLSLATVAIGFGGLAHAQDCPNRPITLIVPWQAGTLADLVERTLGDDLAAILKQPVIIEDRPSASQVVASGTLARAAPNGDTLMVSAMANVIAPAILKTQNFTGNTDFTAVSHVLYVATVLAVAPSVPVNNLREFIALLKAIPGKYMFGSAGVGTPMHMYLEQFNRELETSSVHVPYKSLQFIIPDVSSGVMHHSFLPFSMMRYANEGRMKVLAREDERFLALVREGKTPLE